VRKTLIFELVFAAILAMVLILWVNPAKSASFSASVSIETHGQIAYPQSAPIQIGAPSPFPWYQIIKEIAWWMFGLIGAVCGIFKLLERKKGTSTLRIQRSRLPRGSP
jgi:hypothetical protein